MKRSLLKVLMVMALGAVICLPGVAAADPILLNFDSDFISLTSGDYDLFTWEGWAVEDGAASGVNGAIISIKNGTFDFEGADFSLNLGTNILTITGYNSVTPLAQWKSDDLLGTFTAFTGITKLTFSSDGGFVMDNFKDIAIPLPPTALLLGSGLVGLGLLGWRRRQAS